MIRPVNGSGMKRMALLNDLSCFGKCSLSVAMPILSSYGVETVPLPTAILSTHTADGFGSYVMRDMTDEMKAFAAHWRQLQIKFDGICTGFFGSVEQMHFAKDFLRDFAGEDTIVVVDPVLGDNGAHGGKCHHHRRPPRGGDRLLRAAERAVYGNFQALPSADAAWHG